MNGGKPVEAWKSRLEVLAAVAGTAALIEFVGGAVMYLRFERADLPAAQTVAALPKELLFVVGAHSIVPLLLVGLAAAVMLYAISPNAPPPGAVAPVETKRLEQYPGAPGAPAITAWRLMEPPPPAAPNPPNALPAKFGVVLTVVSIIGLTVAARHHPDFWAWVVLIATAAVTVALGVVATRASTSLSTASWTLFFITLTFGTALALVTEFDKPVKLDIGAVETVKDKRRLGGFFLARTASSVYLVTRPTKKAKLAQVTVIANDDVGKLKYGPRGVKLTRAGFRRAEQLARRLDSVSPMLTVHAGSRQKVGDKHALTITASCSERCRLRVSGYLVGSRTPRVKLTPVTRNHMAAGVTAHIRIRRAGETHITRAVRKDPRLRAHVHVAVRDGGGNKRSISRRIRLTR